METMMGEVNMYILKYVHNEIHEKLFKRGREGEGIKVMQMGRI
jgi:hypothetical protein